MVRPCRHGMCASLFKEWMAHLCGLCLTLRSEHGQSARLVTNYDGLLVSVLVEAQAPVPRSWWALRSRSWRSWRAVRSVAAAGAAAWSRPAQLGADLPGRRGGVLHLRALSAAVELPPQPGLR